MRRPRGGARGVEARGSEERGAHRSLSEAQLVLISTRAARWRPPPTTRALGKMEGAAAAYKELADSYRETLTEEKAAHAATKEELKATKEELKATKAELDQLKAAGAKRPAEAAASPPATKQRTSEDAPPPAQQPDEPMTGNFTPAEDARYLALLNQYGQPKKKDNPAAWAAFSEAFSYARSRRGQRVAARSTSRSTRSGRTGLPGQNGPRTAGLVFSGVSSRSEGRPTATGARRGARSARRHTSVALYVRGA